MEAGYEISEVETTLDGFFFLYKYNSKVAINTHMEEVTDSINMSYLCRSVFCDGY
jgi:hypothetical protein